MTSSSRAIPIVVVAFLAASGAVPEASAQTVRAPGVDSVRVRANIQPQMNTTSVSPEPSSEWLLRRARVGIRVFAAGWIRGELEADFGGGDARLTDGWVRLAFDPAVRIQAGQFKRPFDVLELTSSRELLVVERDGAPRGAAGRTPNGLVTDLGYADRDIGAVWIGSFDRVTATAGFFNGSGANADEDDDGKQLAGRLAVEVADGWEVAGAFSANRVTALVPCAVCEARGGLPSSGPAGLEDIEVEEWFSAGELAVVGGAYGEPGLKALGQVLLGDNFDSDLGGAFEGASFLAFQAIAAYHVPVYEIPYVIGWEPAARLGWTDPHDDVDQDEATLVTAGLNVYHDERVKTQIGVDLLAPAEGETETAFRIQATIGF